MIGRSQAIIEYLFSKGVGDPIYNSIDCERFKLELYNCESYIDSVYEYNSIVLLRSVRKICIWR